MKKFKAIVLLGVVLMVYGCSRNQENHPGPIYDKVLPGAPELRQSRFAPHKVRYSKPGGMMTFVMRKADVDGRAAFEIEVWFNKKEGEGKPDRITFDAKTLGFISRNFGDGDKYEIDVAFKGGRFVGDLIPGEGSGYSPIKYDKAFPHNAFEPSVINYFVAALPLAEGYTSSIPIFDLNNGSQMLWSNIEVIGHETVTVKGKSYDTWKVVSDGVRKKTIWIDENELVAIKMKTSGSPGTWVLAEYEKT